MIKKEITEQDKIILIDPLFYTIKHMIGQFVVHTNNINLDDNLARDFKFDSLDKYELIYNIEKYFNLRIDEATINKLETVRDAYAIAKLALLEEQKNQYIIMTNEVTAQKNKLIKARGNANAL